MKTLFIYICSVLMLLPNLVSAKGAPLLSMVEADEDSIEKIILHSQAILKINGLEPFALTEAERAVNLARMLSDSQSSRYAGIKLRALQNLAFVYAQTDQNDKIESILEEAASYQEKLIEKNQTQRQRIQWLSYLAYSMVTLFFLSILLLKLKQYYPFNWFNKSAHPAEVIPSPPLDSEKEAHLQMVVHDLKTPLSKVEGLAKMIPDTGQLNEIQTKCVNMIQDVVKEGNQMIKEFLTHQEAKRDANVLHHLDIKVLMPHILFPYYQQARKKNIQLHYSAPQGSICIYAHKESITRIVDNLVSNAIKFSPFHRSIYIMLKVQRKTFSIAVQDEGPGISKAEQKLLFQQFSTLSPKPTAGESSNGLGLSIVKSLADSLNGRIEVNSQPGKGSCFTLHLPKCNCN